ncbi:MAG: cell division protein ZapA [Gammaproteobacteria bacterium]|nr:cell division protein ZapA [Gammaproteobacteria bacterium]
MTKKTAAGTAARVADSTKHIRLHVLDKEVSLACKPGEESDLKQAVAYIDKSMRDLRSRNATSSTEKIAIVTAINTASDLLKARDQSSQDPALSNRIAAVTEKLDKLLTEESD